MIDHELWQNASDSDIIDHILPRYHDTHRRQLDELIPLAEKVAGVHAGKFPAEMVPLLHTIQGELLSHMMKEERILFPMLKQGAGRAAAMPVRSPDVSGIEPLLKPSIQTVQFYPKSK